MSPLSLIVVVAVVVVAVAILGFLRHAHAGHRAGGHSPVLETGLRAIDLFTPIPIGGDVLISGDKGSGCRLLGTEIACRLMNHPRQKFHAVYYLDEKLSDVDAQVEELKETLPILSNRYVVSVVTASDVQQHLSPEIAGSGVAIFAVSTNERFVHFFRQAILAARESINESTILTCFVVTESVIPMDFDVTIISSQLIAKEGIYPALDLNASSSSDSSHGSIPAKRRRVAESASAAVKDVEANLYSGALADTDWVFNRDAGKRASLQALRFMSQPYFVAEPYTGKTAAHISVDETVSSFQSIMSGAFMNAEPQAFQYLNAIPPRQ